MLLLDGRCGGVLALLGLGCGFCGSGSLGRLLGLLFLGRLLRRRGGASFWGEYFLLSGFVLLGRVFSAGLRLLDVLEVVDLLLEAVHIQAELLQLQRKDRE